MRVLHVGKFWPPYAGGIERSMHGLCTALAASGVTVDALVHASPGQWRGCTQLDEGVRVERVACFGQLAYTPLSPGFAAALARQIRQHRPQILHLHLPNPSAFWALLLPAARRLPWVLHWHSDIPLEQARAAVRMLYPLYRPWQNALLRRARQIIVTSPAYRDHSRTLKPWRHKTVVVPLALGPAPAPDAAAIKAAHGLWPGQGLRLLAVGRLSHYKGFDVLLRALAISPGVQLLLVGSGECEAQLRRLLAELNLAHRVHLPGALDDAARDAAYTAAELFCLPSVARSEAFGMVLLEAMRAGLPCIASDVPGSGMSFVLDAGHAGRLTRAADSNALAAALLELALDPALRESLARAGQQRCQDVFSSAAMTRRIMAIYQACLQV